VIQPVVQAAELCRRHGAVLHVDAVQAASRLPLNLALLGCDSLAISSHKLGGPAGIGALLLAPDAPFAAALIGGGGQERGRRGGTPPVALASGFAAAAVARDDPARLAALRDAAEAAAVAAGAIVCGDTANRLPNTTCLALPGVRADAQVIALDLEGVAVSAGSACSSGKVAASHVLTAMGLGSLAGEAIRVSLPWNATAADIEGFASAYRRVAARLRPALVPSAA
jgi:cysteine desulfurase